MIILPIIIENYKYLKDLQAVVQSTESIRDIEQMENDLPIMALEQASESIIITDNQGCICYINPAFEHVTGYTRDQAIGQNISILDSGNQSDRSHWSVCKDIQPGGSWSGRLVSKRHDDRYYHEGASISPLIDDNGNLSNFFWVCRDVSQEIGIENRLRESQKLQSIGQLAAGIAHEINTPMQYIGDNTRFLKASFTDMLTLVNQYKQLIDLMKQNHIDAEIVSFAETALAAADIDFLVSEIPEAFKQTLEGIDRVTKMVRAMKEFSHPSKAEKTPTDINKAIETTINVARNEWKYVADLTTDLDPHLPLVTCLPGEFNQVILNLIVNAAHAISEIKAENPGKGLITISTKQDNDIAVMSVSDTGAGIPEEIRSRIFDPFFTTKKVGKGTGQGLAVSRSVIVEQHGGTIDFITEKGKGTTFNVCIPISSTDAMAN